MPRFLSLSELTKACLYSLFIIALSAPAAMAQTNSEGAAKLKTLFTDYIEKSKNDVSYDGSELIASGAVKVEEKGSYYAITLPDLTVKTAEGGKVDIGVIAVNALPADDPGQWKMTIAIPTPIVAFNEDDEAEFIFEIGQQSFAGIFHEEFNTFTKYRAEYNNAAMKFPEEKLEIRFPQMRGLQNLVKGANGLWSGPNDFETKDIAIISKGETVAKIGEVRLDSQTNDYDLGKAMEYLEQFEAIGESMAASGDAAMESPQHVLAMYNLIFKLISETFDGGDLDLTAKDIAVKNIKDTSKSFKLDKASFGVGMSGFLSNRVRLQYRVNYDGFSVPSMDPQLTEIIPSRFNLNISLNELPFNELVSLGQTSLQGVLEQPQAAQMVGLQAMMTLPQLLTQASSNMTLNNNYIGNDQYNVAVNGILTADHNAVKGGYGNATIEIFGIDRLIELTNSNLQNPNIPSNKKDELQKMLGGLNAAKLFGQQRTDAQGRPIHAYDIELTKEGRAMLNGSDIMAIMQQQGGQ